MSQPWQQFDVMVSCYGNGFCSMINRIDSHMIWLTFECCGHCNMLFSYACEGYVINKIIFRARLKQYSHEYNGDDIPRSVV